MNLSITDKNYSNYTPNFQAVPVKVAKEKLGSVIYYGMGAMSLAAANMMLVSKNKASDISPAPTPQNVLKDVKEPLMIGDDVIFNPANPDCINIDALKAFNSDSSKPVKIADNASSSIKNIAIKCLGQNHFGITFEYQNSRYEIYNVPDSNYVRSISKYTDIDNGITKHEYINSAKQQYPNSRPDRKAFSEISYLAGNEHGMKEIGIKYNLEDSDNLTAERFINPNADASMQRYPYEGKVDEKSIIKELTEFSNQLENGWKK